MAAKSAAAKSAAAKSAAAAQPASRQPIPNVLATRYASPEMTHIWSAEHKIAMERRLWVEILRGQKDLGLDVPDGVVEDYEKEIDNIDLASIEARERVTRHDVKARIEEFCDLAGHEQIHRAMTSRDVTENIEQAQLRASLELVRDRLVAVLARLCVMADYYDGMAVVGRTHNVPAQLTTLGKRWATIGCEVLDAIGRLKDLLERFPLRGLKGPVGTQQDMANLLGNAKAVRELERRIAEHLGFKRVMNSVGQVYPRSHDLDVVATLTSAAAPLGNAAYLVRLMAGNELATEGFRDGQVGSTAMPHKMNTRSSERISGLLVVLRGHLAMIAQLAGDQWLEGDVSCSVVRRVALPDACFAIDGAIETTLEVLHDFGAFEIMIDTEVLNYLPFMATTRLLNAAVAAGCGREQAHELISEYAVDAIRQRRTGTLADGETISEKAADDDPFELSSLSTTTFLVNISEDDRLGLSWDDVMYIVTDRNSFTGLANQQIRKFIGDAKRVLRSYPEALASYQPRPTL